MSCRLDTPEKQSCYKQHFKGAGLAWCYWLRDLSAPMCPADTCAHSRKVCYAAPIICADAVLHAVDGGTSSGLHSCVAVCCTSAATLQCHLVSLQALCVVMDRYCDKGAKQPNTSTATAIMRWCRSGVKTAEAELGLSLGISCCRGQHYITEFVCVGVLGFWQCLDECSGHRLVPASPA